MDTITAFAKSKNGSLNIDKFVVAGASKVTTAGVVVAIAIYALARLDNVDNRCR